MAATFGPFGWDVEFEVGDATPGRRIAWRSVSGAPFDLDGTVDLEPLGPASTKATYAADIRLHGLWRLLSPMVAKSQVEAAAVMAPAMS